jgi:hypothetical protein
MPTRVAAAFFVVSETAVTLGAGTASASCNAIKRQVSQRTECQSGSACGIGGERASGCAVQIATGNIFPIDPMGLGKF